VSESLTALASPADSKHYDKGLAAKKEATKVSSNEREISKPVAKYLGSMTSPKGAEAEAVSTDNIAQDKSIKHSIEPDLSDRRA